MKRAKVGSAANAMVVKKINIAFISQDGSRYFFAIHKDTKVRVLIQAFCNKRQDMDFTEAVFLYDGKRLPMDQTINEVGLKDYDEIDVMFTQTGGGGMCIY